LAEAVPEGFEIYENPNAQVVLRRILPKLITDAELQVVEEEMRRFPYLKYCRLDVKGDTITLFEPNHTVEGFAKLPDRFGAGMSRRAEEWFEESMSFSPMLRFVLVDEAKRTFVAQRYCFRGSIDDWIPIGLGARGSLASLAHAYVRHLCQESFFELF
jgi:hypothetical protein